MNSPKGTNGIISSSNRKLKSRPGYMQAKFEDCNYVYQTDATINGDNSGGPLINEYAMVVGVAVYEVQEASTEKLSFAIPSKSSFSLYKLLSDIPPFAFLKTWKKLRNAKHSRRLQR